MELLPEALTLNGIFGMSTSITLFSDILEAAKLAAEKNDLRQTLRRSEESAGSNAADELPAYDCGGPPWSISMTRAQTGSNNSALRTIGCSPTVCSEKTFGASVGGCPLK